VDSSMGLPPISVGLVSLQEYAAGLV
jgi:hypothetical protein